MAKGRSGRVELLDGRRPVLLLIWEIRNGFIMFDRRACGASFSRIFFYFPLLVPLVFLHWWFGLSALGIEILLFLFARYKSGQVMYPESVLSICVPFSFRMGFVCSRVSGKGGYRNLHA